MTLTTLGLEESIRNGWPVVALAEIDHPDEGMQRLWDGVGTLSWNGYSWTGIGPFGRMSGIGGSKRLMLRAVTFQILGIPPHIEIYLNERLRNRPARAWIAGMDERGVRVNGEPFQEVDGLCDYQTHTADENGIQSVSLIVGEPVYSIERAQTLSFTPEWINSYLQGWRTRNLAGERITGYDRLSELANATRSWTRT